MSRIRPILFNTEMVRAILDGRKTVTRRLMKPQPVNKNGFWELGGAGWSDGISKIHPIPCHSLYNRSPYQPGDILYVRETWCNANKEGVEPDYYYYADVYICEDYNRTEWKWRPSIHMPKEAARIWLKVTDVRVEWLKDITEEEAKKEGFSCRNEFVRTFLNIYPECTEESWLWVIEFEQCEKPEPCILKGMEPAENKRPCIGYAVSDIDDEPCDMCKGCKQCSGNDEYERCEKLKEWRQSNKCLS